MPASPSTRTRASRQSRPVTIARAARSTPHDDVVIIGAGILGLAHAAVARRRGLRVRVLDRDARAVGASVRNFGHVCTTAQPAEHQGVAQRSRLGWLAAASRYGFPVLEAGTLVLADRPEAEAVLAELAERRPSEVRLLTKSQLAEATSGLIAPAVTGGAHLPADLRVDPRSTVDRLAAALAADEVEFGWRHHVHAIDDRGDRVIVETNRGSFSADLVVCCVGHDLDQLAATAADEHNVRRCWLSMMRLAAPGVRLDPAVLTVTSMLRYGAFAEVPSHAELAASIRTEHPALLDRVANVMATQLPDGSLVLGDSHDYAQAVSPFLDVATESLLRSELSRLLRVADLPVIERWQGVYADSPDTDLVEHAPSQGVRFVTVASGIGMTLSFGLAERTFADHRGRQKHPNAAATPAVSTSLSPTTSQSMEYSI